MIDWRAQLAGKCPKSATCETRDAFADAVLSQLDEAYGRGIREENAHRRKQQLMVAMVRVRGSINDLQAEIALDLVFAKRLGLIPSIIAPFAKDVDGWLSLMSKSSSSAYNRTSAESLGFGKARRGRRNRAAIEIAMMTATEYRRFFGRLPGLSKESDSNNPFTRICKMLGTKLQSDHGLGTRYPIGFCARAEAIERLRIEERERLNGDLEVVPYGSKTAVETR